MSENTEIRRPEERPEPSSGKMIFTLGVAGFLSGLVIVSVYLFTLPMIQAHKAKAMREAIYEVLPGCADFKTLVLENGRLAEVGDDQASQEKEDTKSIFAGYDESGNFIGFAITAEESGYQDIIGGIFGYDPEKKIIIGFKVLESKETPGLGDKIIKDETFQVNFKALAVEPEILAVKKGEKKQPNEVEAITGATISSKAIVRLLQNGINEWKEAIDKRESQK